jgi:hypothetical protein
VKPQGEFIIVPLSVKNIGDEPQSHYGANQKLVDTNRRQYGSNGEAAMWMNKSPGPLSSWGFKTLSATALMFGNRRPLFNVGVSNVPGPQAPLYMNGARAERIFGVAPIFDGTALVFGVVSRMTRCSRRCHPCRP